MNGLQSEMHWAMVERTKERAEGWHIHLLDKFFLMTRLTHTTIIGMFSWSSSPIHVKWLSKRHARNYGGGYITPGDIARDYLALKYPNRRIRVTSSQWHACVERRSKVPMFCTPMQLEQGVYIDLVSAYWSILKVVGWDVNYNPNKFLAVNSAMNDFPYPAEKMARNCLVSVGLPSTVRIWTGKELTFGAKPNRFINLVLWRLVTDVLNGVASEMVKAGAVYVHTDGYILPDNKAALAFEILDSWGLPSSIKYSGETDVRAVGGYRVGTQQTMVYKESKRKIPMTCIDNSAADFLKPRFKRFADTAKYNHEFLKEF
jgi:hypothetical protein